MRVRKTFTVNLIDNPNWIPTAGHSTVISTNGIQDVLAPTTPTVQAGSGQGHWHMFDQSGMMYNPYYGTNGALFAGGPMGGHFGRKATGSYLFEVVQDGAWVNLQRDYGGDLYQTVGSGNNGWYDLSGFYAGRYTQGIDSATRGTDLGNNNYGDYITGLWDFNSPGWYGYTPSTNHTRGNVVFVPGGTGNKGQMVLPFSHGNYSGQGFRYVHIMDCGREAPTALTYDSTKQWWKRGGRLPIPGTDGTVPNGLGVTSGMYQGAVTWFEPDQNRVGVLGTVFEGSAARTIFYLGTDQHPTNPWTYFVGPRTAAGVFMYMNADCGGGYVPNRRLLFHCMPPNNVNNGAQPGGTGCIQFQMIDLANPSATFFTPVPMQFANPTQGPQMPYTTTTLPIGQQENNLVGIDLTYCPFDGAFWFVWNSRHQKTYNPPYGDTDVTIWRLRPVNRDLRSTDTNASIMADTWEWTNMTEAITPKLDCGLAKFVLGPSPNGAGAGTMGVLDYVYRGIHYIQSLNCFVFCRGSNSVASPYYGSVQLFKPPGF